MRSLKPSRYVLGKVALCRRREDRPGRLPAFDSDKETMDWKMNGLGIEVPSGTCGTTRRSTFKEFPVASITYAATPNATGGC